jgi:hypothetical protein
LLAILAALAIWRQGMPRPIVVPPAARPVLLLPPLANKLVRVHYHQVQLSQVLADLSRQAGVAFDVDWKSLSPAGMEPGRSIDCDSQSERPISLKAALALLGGNQAVLDADFTSDPLFISTSEGIGKRVLLVSYPVADLLQIEDPWATANTRQIQEWGLIKIIEAFVEPDKWKDVGGTVGNMTLFGDKLLVTATPMMHYQIRQLFDELRRQK